MKYFVLFLLCGLAISGCSSNVKLSGRYLSNLDPSVEVNKSASIQVVSSSSGNALTNKRFIPDVIAALKKRGFQNVSQNEQKPDYTLAINFTAENQNELRTVPVFSHERGLPYTVCNKDLSKNTQTCTTHYYSLAPVVSGYRTIRTPTTVYTFHFVLNDQNKHTVLESESTVVHDNCSQWKVFKFLASDAIAQTSFSTPVDKSYSVTMPKTYSCQ